MQVLESTVFSAILAAADRRTVEAGRLLEVGASRRMTDYEQRTEGVQGWRDVQWLRRMKEWAIFAFVACPGMFAFTTLNTPNYQPDWGGWARGGGGSGNRCTWRQGGQCEVVQYCCVRLYPQHAQSESRVWEDT